MSRPVTYTCLILDQSGSMSTRREFAVQAYNELVEQAQLNSVDQDIFVSLLTFNGNVYEHVWNVPADQLRKSTANDYKCEGSTALNDAIGYAVNKLLATTNKDDPNVGYYLKVVTDGEENQSVRYGNNLVGLTSDRRGHEELQELVKEVQKSGKWTFDFMGCDVKYLEKLAKQMSTPVNNMAAFSPNNAMAAGFMGAVATNKVYRSRIANKLVDHEVYTSGGIVTDYDDQSLGLAKVALANASASVGNVSNLKCNLESTSNVFTSNTPVNLSVVQSSSTV